MNKFDRRLMITRRGALVAFATSIMLAAAVLPGSAQTETAPPPAVTSVHVSIDNFSFTPQALAVKVGTTVTWTNRDDIPMGYRQTTKPLPDRRRWILMTAIRSRLPRPAPSNISASSIRI